MATPKASSKSSKPKGKPMGSVGKKDDKSSKLATLKSFVFGGGSKSASSSSKKSAAAPVKAGASKAAATSKKVASIKAAPAKPAASAKAPASKAPASKAPVAAKGKTAAAPAAPAAKPLTKPARKSKGTPKAPIYTSGIRNGITVQIDSNGEAVCREVACDGLATSGGYCRLHYIKNWKMIKRKEIILKEGKLIRYIEELVAKYPEKYIEAILMDLTSDKEFAQVIHDLDLDESVEDFEADGENVDGLVDNIKRDFDDDTEGF